MAVIIPAERVRWGAIFAGVVFAFAVQVLLVLFGLAVGFQSINFAAANPFSGLGWGTVVWLLLATVVSLFLGGWLALRLSGVAQRGIGALNGVLVWSLMLVFGTFAAGTTLSGAVGGMAGNLLRSPQVSETLMEKVPSRQELQQQAREQARQPQGRAQGQGQGGQAQPPEQPGIQDDLAQSLQRNLNLAPAEAQRLAQQIQANAATGAEGAATAAWGSLLFLVLLLVASSLGGLLGTPREQAGAVVV